MKANQDHVAQRVALESGQTIPPARPNRSACPCFSKTRLAVPVHQTRGRILDSAYAAGKLLKELLNVKLALPGTADAVRTHREALSQFSRPRKAYRHIPSRSYRSALGKAARQEGARRQRRSRRGGFYVYRRSCVECDRGGFCRLPPSSRKRLPTSFSLLRTAQGWVVNPIQAYLRPKKQCRNEIFPSFLHDVD
jgi:hypothetical protein